MPDNKALRAANRAKQDEFYTQLVDIENELKHYKEHFNNKIVFCNCDDPYESNFFKFFAINFNHLGLKRLIATCYDSSPIAYTQLNMFNENKIADNNNRHAYKIEINEVKDYNEDGATDLADVEFLLKNDKNSMQLLKEDGDFRSQECIELLKQADIVVTNPPFSLFREYVAQLMQYEKKFLIIGNQNAITYKEIFKLIKNNKLWAGVSFNKTFDFIMSNDYKLKGNGYIDKFGHKHGFVSGICWFTNLEISKRYENLNLYKNYNEQEYPKYANYDAINVNKVNDIPYDYNGYIGVPITFMDKYNPNQFEIIGLGISSSGIEIGVKPYKQAHRKYRKEVEKKAAVDGDLYYLDNLGNPKVPYARIIIKRR